MNTIFIDCRLGVTGAKLLGALVELTDNPDVFIKRFNDLGMDGIRMSRFRERVGGVKGSRIEFLKIDSTISYDDELDEEEDKHVHRHHTRRKLKDVIDIIDDLPLSGKVRKRAAAIYDAIAEVSAIANNRDKYEQFLNRTGSKAIIASVVGVCMLVEELEYDQIVTSPIAVGKGYAMTSRGNLPIPIPALQKLLGDTPYLAGTEEGEICTLEGAAILKNISDKFDDIPEMTIIKEGCGFGMYSYKTGINSLRVVLGKIVQTAANEVYTELEATLYNDTAQSLSITADRLEKIGVAENVYTMPITTLLGEHGVLLKCICKQEDADNAASEILRNTSATSVRRSSVAAYKTQETTEIKSTSFGDVRIIKINGFGVSTVKISPDDVAEAARKNNMSYGEAYDIIAKEI